MGEEVICQAQESADHLMLVCREKLVSFHCFLDRDSISIPFVLGVGNPEKGEKWLHGRGNREQL